MLVFCINLQQTRINTLNQLRFWFSDCVRTRHCSNQVSQPYIKESSLEVKTAKFFLPNVTSVFQFLLFHKILLVNFAENSCILVSWSAGVVEISFLRACAKNSKLLTACLYTWVELFSGLCRSQISQEWVTLLHCTNYIVSLLCYV